MSSTDNEVRWRAYADSLTWAKGSLDDSTWRAALRGYSLGVAPQTVFDEAFVRIKAAGDRPNRAKITAQIRRAYHSETAVAAHAHASPVRKMTYRPELVEKLTANLPDELDTAYLECRSAFTCWNRSPAGFLHALFRPGEKVFVTTTPLRRRGIIWSRRSGSQDLGELDWLTNGQPGVWYLTNPVCGERKLVERLQSEQNPEGETWRAEECVTAWRYAVLESDSVESQSWLKALVQLPLPIVAIYESGGSSIHALLRVGATTKPEWDTTVSARLLPYVIQLGADPQALTAVRLSRLPNCKREETGRLQRLLYLSPAADSTPICQLPEKEPTSAVQERMREAVELAEQADPDRFEGGVWS